MGSSTRRFLVLGLDGGTFDLLDPLMEAGELPFLRSLVRGGLRAPLTSVYPAKTIPAWYSFATGQDPGELGIFGFTEPDGGPGRSKFVQTFRPAEAIWDRLSRRGVKVGVLNLPLRTGYPLHGFVVPGFFAEESETFPREVRREVEAALGCPYPGELPVYRAADRAEWIAAATRSLVQRAQAATVLTGSHRPDFLFVLFRETDRIEHQFWNELARPVSEIPTDLLGFWRAVDTACRDVDAAFRAAGGPSITLVLSDHGHGAARSDFLTNRWLAQEKFLVFRHGDALGGRNLVARTILASQRYAVFRKLAPPIAAFLGGRRQQRVARLVGGATSFEQMASRIDWQRTLAYSYPVPEGIYLNTQNPELAHDPARREAVLADLKRRLEAYPDARIEVFDPRTIYRGNHLERAPSLLFRVDGMTTEPYMDFRYPRPLIRERPDFFFGSGTHRMNGILIAAGEGVRPGQVHQALSLLDVAPTILEGMGIPAGPELGGRSFAGPLGFAT
ncbi:MAG TPA: alkaline phosphatase family protein [Thermoplasmata archaeon]|nr:alkaline phosphatase family protein [Thermoplasmata archaeon]